MAALGVIPTKQHLTSDGSLGQAPVLYEPPYELQVDVLTQMPDSPHLPVAALPVHLPLRAAKAAKGRVARTRMECIVVIWSLPVRG